MPRLILLTTRFERSGVSHAARTAVFDAVLDLPRGHGSSSLFLAREASIVDMAPDGCDVYYLDLNRHMLDAPRKRAYVFAASEREVLDRLEAADVLCG